MEISTQQVTEFYQLLPEWLQKHAIIAGGAAVNFRRATDVDIWLLASDGDLMDSELVRKDINKHLTEMSKVDFGPLSDFEERPRDPVVIDSEYGPNVDGYVMFAGTFRGKPFQILVTRFETTEKLLIHFDLSVHQMAVERDGHPIRVGTTSMPGRLISITNFHSPDHTFTRLRKLWRRYGGAIDSGSLIALAQSVGDGKKGLENEN